MTASNNKKSLWHIIKGMNLTDVIIRKNNRVTFSWFADELHNFSSDTGFFLSIWGQSEQQLEIPSLGGCWQRQSVHSSTSLEMKWSHKWEECHFISPHVILTLFAVLLASIVYPFLWMKCIFSEPRLPQAPGRTAQSRVSGTNTNLSSVLRMARL